MDQTILVQTQPTLSDEIRSEIIRKSVHMLVAAVPTLALMIGTLPAMMTLASGTMLYTYAEVRRRHGFSIPIITRITELSSRSRELDRFVLGPITLGIGAMLALLLYPHPAASIAIYALAFGDGIASVVGKIFGRIRIPLTGGKTLEGTLACTFAVALCAFLIIPSAGSALTIAIVAAILEVFPSRDADNLILPVGVGLTATFLM